MVYSSIEMRRRRRTRRKLIPFFFFLIGATCLILIIISHLWHLGARASKEIAGVSTRIEKAIGFPTPTPISFLPKILREALVDTKGSYGISVKHLKTSEAYSLNPHRIYKSASLYKLWVMGTIYDQIENGKVKESDILSRDLNALLVKFNVATGSAQPQDGPTPEPNLITLSVHDALFRMITYSDNNSALLLTEKAGLSNIGNYLKKHEFFESKLGTSSSEPVTTAADISLFFEKLYKGELTNKENTGKILTLLKQQKINRKLPKYLPETVDIAHKTGELYFFTHDAGIVYTPKGEYIIVVLSETNLPPQAEERIATISKTIYNYFTTQ